MWKTAITILRGRQDRRERAMETANAAVIIERKVTEAETAHGSAKRALASLIVKIESEERALAVLESRLSDLTERTRAALDAGKDDLARDAASLVAQLENEREVRERTLATSRAKAERLRLSVERVHRQVIDLRQGLITARSVELERRALGGAASSMSAGAAIREGEAVLRRLLDSEDPVALDETLDRIEDDLSGRSTEESLAEAGFGAPLRVRADDVLDRLRASPESETKAKTTSKAAKA